MPKPPTSVSLDDGIVPMLRDKMGLPANTPTSQVIRAALLRYLGHADADGTPVNRGGKRYTFGREPADR